MHHWRATPKYDKAKNYCVNLSLLTVDRADTRMQKYALIICPSCATKATIVVCAKTKGLTHLARNETFVNPQRASKNGVLGHAKGGVVRILATSDSRAHQHVSNVICYSYYCCKKDYTVRKFMTIPDAPTRKELQKNIEAEVPALATRPTKRIITVATTTISVSGV